MNCLNKKCTIKNQDERMVVCWLCHGLSHYKCSGLSTLVAEATQKQDGVHWCCLNCRKTGVEFYKFFQARKTLFHKIQNEFSNVSNRLCDYGKLFDNYPLLDYNEPSQEVSNQPTPLQSPKLRKSARTNKKSESDIIVEPTVINSSIAPVISKPPVEHLSQSTSNDIGLQSSSHTNLSSFVPRELRVLPPKKHLFVSRFASETTVDDINFYIKSKLNLNENIVAYKFSYAQPRSITSFKISVSSDVFNQLMDTSFWPEHTLVREFLTRPKERTSNVARLPPTIPSVSKN